MPESWLATGAALGTNSECAARLRDYLDAGADEIVLHGNAPLAMEELVNDLAQLKE